AVLQWRKTDAASSEPPTCTGAASSGVESQPDVVAYVHARPGDERIAEVRIRHGVLIARDVGGVQLRRDVHVGEGDGRADVQAHVKGVVLRRWIVGECLVTGGEAQSESDIGVEMERLANAGIDIDEAGWLRDGLQRPIV